MIKKLMFTAVFALALVQVSFAAVSILKTEVRDGSGMARTRFSSTERLTLYVQSNNSSAVSRLNYTFTILSPTGQRVFYHTGNSSPGNIGLGGSSLQNIAPNYYTGPGYYTFKAGVTSTGGSAVESSVRFYVFAPVINLLYPPSNARDLIDNPLTFRWVTSGAAKYEVKVSEDQGFYKTIWTGVTTMDSISYPVISLDERQKLKGGQPYYWKVWGYDTNGQQIVASEIREFSVKEETASGFSKNLSVEDIKLDPASAVPGRIILSVKVNNTGSQTETDIKLTLHVDGRSEGTEVIPVINSGQSATASFNIGEQVKAMLLASAVLDISDDDSRDNILTKKIFIPLPEEYRNVPKIIGKVTDSFSYTGLDKVKIDFDGPSQGSLYSQSNGQFKIENLKTGKYTITFSHKDYEKKDISVEIEKAKAYPVPAIELIKVKKEEKNAAVTETVREYSMEEAYKLLLKHISKNMSDQLTGYKLTFISVDPLTDVNAVLQRLEEDKVKIEEERLSIK